MVPFLSSRPSSNAPRVEPSLDLRQPITTQSAVRWCLIFTQKRLPGTYGPFQDLAITPSSPAPSNFSNHSSAFFGSRVYGVRKIGLLTPLSSFLTPYTRDPKKADEWFEKFEGAGLDGVMAKSWNGPYVPGKRFWVKIKHQRTADCVVIGWRKSSDGSTLGALLLGLYDKKGTMHYVGHTSCPSCHRGPAEARPALSRRSTCAIRSPRSPRSAGA